jgi:hypothetical protein
MPCNAGIPPGYGVAESHVRRDDVIRKSIDKHRRLRLAVKRVKKRSFKNAHARDSTAHPSLAHRVTVDKFHSAGRLTKFRFELSNDLNMGGALPGAGRNMAACLCRRRAGATLAQIGPSFDRGNTRPLFDWDLNRRCDPDADHEYEISRMSPFVPSDFRAKKFVSI